MIISGYIWMAAVLVLFLISMYGVYSRNLFSLRPLLALVPAVALAYWLRVETYLFFMRIMAFSELEHTFLLGATIFGQVLLIGYIFVILALINIVFPRTLRFADIFFLACFSGFGISLLTVLYGIAKVATTSLAFL